MSLTNILVRGIGVILALVGLGLVLTAVGLTILTLTFLTPGWSLIVGIALIFIGGYLALGGTPRV